MRWLSIALACMLVFPLSACGNKGKLKTPSEIQQDQAKKEKEAAKKEKKKNQKADQSSKAVEQESSGFPLTRE
ncbi:MAG: hypothetical protein LW823_07225 [Rickettsiales bacterium]|jgi:predicted small lipoprotein YifL|nr:hypothetical protein [Rickettsiales bacterium]